MKQLPKQLPWSQATNQWPAVLNPILSNPINNANILKNLTLTSGKNVINHKLGATLNGWIPTRVRSAATFYDTQDSNPTPDLTLVLYASAACTIDLAVF